MKQGRSAGRERLLDQLARDYRKVLDGTGNEKAFGEKLEQYKIGRGELAEISRLARSRGAVVDYV
jgi:hypothetical protein